MKERVDAVADELAQQVARHRELAAELARVAETSAVVHDEVAQVAEDLRLSRLSPEALREHADRDRLLAARERERAQEP